MIIQKMRRNYQSIAISICQAPTNDSEYDEDRTENEESEGSDHDQDEGGK